MHHPMRATTIVLGVLLVAGCSTPTESTYAAAITAEIGPWLEHVEAINRQSDLIAVVETSLPDDDLSRGPATMICRALEAPTDQAALAGLKAVRVHATNGEALRTCMLDY